MEKTTSSTTPTKNFVKVSVREIPLPKEKKGFSIEGEFVSIVKKPFAKINQKTMEVEDAEFKKCILIQAGERVSIGCDMGLFEALNDSEIKAGDYVRLTNHGKKQIKNGTLTMNIWDVEKAL